MILTTKRLKPSRLNVHNFTTVLMNDYSETSISSAESPIEIGLQNKRFWIEK